MKRTALIAAAVLLLGAVWLLLVREPIAASARSTQASPPDARSEATGRTGTKAGTKNERREQLLRELTKARQERLHMPAPAPIMPAPEHDATFDREYVMKQMETVAPYLTDCYNQASMKDPKLEGTLFVAFRLVGEPGIGGVIEFSEVHEDKSTPALLKNKELVECAENSLYAIEFKAPPVGGHVDIAYPFEFHPRSYYEKQGGKGEPSDEEIKVEARPSSP